MMRGRRGSHPVIVIGLVIVVIVFVYILLVLAFSSAPTPNASLQVSGPLYVGCEETPHFAAEGLNPDGSVTLSWVSSGNATPQQAAYATDGNGNVNGDAPPIQMGYAGTATLDLNGAGAMLSANVQVVPLPAGDSCPSA